ncbi:ankyrin repeat and mynd domain-containing protein 2-like [Moniliophthora roreri]|nr:ankyrin repeat and mynd domain-containing protein 2-like [Moniliophthora roreri]
MDNIVIGDFMFCAEHGSEYCNKCCCDHRMCNNIRIEEELHKAFPGFTEEQFLNRPPLSNALDLAVESRTKDSESEPLYRCKAHKKIDCENCFDWGKLAVAKIKRIDDSDNTIPITATREQKLGLLASMGIEVPPSTRLPESAVEHKLQKAIDATQYLKKVLPDASATPIDPKSFPLWSQTTNPKSIYESTRRGNIAEALQNTRAKLAGTTAFPLYESAFMDVRQTIMALAKYMDNGVDRAIMQDKDKNAAICIRVVEVRKVAEGVPMLVVLCGRGTRDMPVMTTGVWVQETISSRRQLPQITATPEEQDLFLNILNMNSRRLASGYKPSRKKSEQSFMLSFLLPMGPMSQEDLGKLTTNASGCIICGHKTTSKCSQCLSVEYCGRECQRAHWKEHKLMCTTLKGGKWSKVKLATAPPEFRAAAAQGKPLYAMSLNYQTPLDQHDLSQLEKAEA